MNGKFNYIFIGITILLTLTIFTGCATTTATGVSPTSSSQTPGYPAPIKNIGTAYPISVTPDKENINVISPTTTPDPRISPLIILKVTHIDSLEVITLKNISGVDQDLKLYTIVEPSSQQFKRFQDSYIIKPDATYDVYNGPNPGNVSADQIWLSAPVLKNQYDELYLLNNAAAIIWTYTYVPSSK